jgi:hypothetical protein
MIGPLPANVELNAAMLENQRWLSQIELDDLEAVTQQPKPDSLPRVGIEGAGFFVLDDAGARIFARAMTPHVGRDGFLVDERGRKVLGFAPQVAGAAHNNGGLIALRVPERDARLYRSYEFGSGGSVWATLKSAEHKRGSEPKVMLGQLGIAIFPNPQSLESMDRETLVATARTGTAHYLPAGAPNVGRLRLNPATPSHEALLSNLRALWSLSGRAEVEIALAASKDALARIALDLVR